MRLSWGDFHVGQTFEEQTIGPMTLTDIVKYQGASGDFHPAHHDQAYAKAHGYPKIFSLGLLPAGQLLSIVSEWFGRENIRGFSIRFRGILWPDDVLVCSVEVVDKVETAHGRRVTLDLTCRQQEVAVVEATATFEVQDT